MSNVRTAVMAGLLMLSACGTAPAPETSAAVTTIGTPSSDRALVRLLLPNLKTVSAQYLNPTQTATLSVSVDSGTPVVLTLSSLHCTAGGCPVNVYVSSGLHTFTVKSYSSAGVLISQGSQSLNVLLAQNNALDITLDPEISSYVMHSAVQQLNPTTKHFGNYTRFPFSGGHSLVAYYDVSAKDAVGDSLPSVLCGDAGVVSTNISTASFPNRYRVELTTAGIHTLTARTGSSCSAGSGIVSQSVKTVKGTGVAGGESHSLALMADGTIRAFGRGYYGELGDNSTSDSPMPVTVTGISNAVEVAAGQEHSLALLADGTLRAWGRGDFGQLGNNSTSDSPIPVTVTGISDAVSVAGGQYFSLALMADGTIRAWGRGGSGQLGDNSTTDSPIPMTVTGISNAVEVAAGGNYSVALLPDGTVRAWGWNYQGQLGDNSTTNSPIPVTVTGITNAIAVASGGYHSVALLSDGTLRAWGWNSQGQLGDNSTTDGLIPVTVSGISGAAGVAGGIFHSVALLSDGTVRAWGYNSNGQLGDNSTTNSPIPVTVAGITNAIAVAGGGYHSVALLSDGTLRAWGWNSQGQLGDGTSLNNRLTPVTVSGITAAVPSP